MSKEPTHILGRFQRALDELVEDLNRMSAIVTRSLENAFRGLRDRDTSLCAQVIADDEEVDQLEMKLDEEGLKIIMLYQPVASDLRKVVSVMKVSSNLERVGDQAVGIAKRGRKLNKSLELPETRLVEPVYDKAASLLRRSLEAFREGKVEVALEVKDEDAELDKAYKAVAKQLTGRMEEDSGRVKDYLDLQFVVRFLERIGDHAKNIAEDAVFAESAHDIRHGGERPEID
ncbi:MAG: phosphate signaling complex protein PhoU [Akkermansiaceae bacterium]|nr:phosphate signaling complex protein PhoU [Akkermansiaceae bacterium]